MIAELTDEQISDVLKSDFTGKSADEITAERERCAAICEKVATEQEIFARELGLDSEAAPVLRSLAQRIRKS